MRTFVTGLVLAALLALSGLAWGAAHKNVYLKDGGIIEAQSVWREGDTVRVLVNRDTLVDLSASEVNLKKTFPPVKAVKKKKPAPAAVQAPCPEPGATAAAVPPPTKPASQLAPAPAKPEAPKAPTPPPTVAAAKPGEKPVDVKPAPAEPGAPKPAAPAVKPPPPKKLPPHPPVQEMPPEAAGFAMAMAAMGMVPLIIIGLIALFFIISYWKLFEKAGEAGWKSLIPIYNIIIMLKIAGKPWWWFLLMLVPLVNIIITLLWCLALAQKFGKSQLFGVGLFLLSFIFIPILAFDKSRYQG